MLASGPDLPQRIAIIGPGLIGASIGLTLKARGCPAHVLGVDTDASNLAAAIACGALDAGSSDPAQLAGCGLVVVAVPPRHIPTVFAAVRRHAPATATVTDTASIKCAVADAARQLFGTDSGRIIGAHPMAGSEQTGANAARADLLPGQTCVLTESPGDAPTSRALVRALWQDWLGMRVVVMTPEAHDAAVASVSHLPHLTSSALVCAASALGGLELAAGGFRDTTRIAAGDPSLWTDIALHNAAALDTALAELQSRLAALRLALHQRDSHTLRQLLEAGRDNRLAWEASQADPRNVPSPPRPAARD